MPQANTVDVAGLAGQLIRHQRSRTLSQMDNTWYTLLTLNTANHFDLARGAKKEFGQVLMNSTFTLAVAVGILTHEFGGEAARRMALQDVRLVKTMFGGDTLALESQVGQVEGDRISVASTGRNQNGEAVIELTWAYLLRGEGFAELLKAAADQAPKLDPKRVFTPQIYAPAFEDFTVGQLHNHETGRTLLRDESIWMSLVSMRQGGAYQDVNAAAALGLPDILVDETFVLSTVLGVGVKHATQRAVANLGWRDIRFWTPVYPGDTVYSESKVVDARLSASRPGQGIISLQTTGRNQRDEVVVTYDRSFLTYCRDNPARLLV
jgi:itaconyl-CoA hydratase